MSRTPAQGADAIDRDNQYLMKIKRRVALDLWRPEENSEEIQESIIKLMALLYKHKPPVVVASSVTKKPKSKTKKHKPAK